MGDPSESPDRRTGAAWAWTDPVVADTAVVAAPAATVQVGGAGVVTAPAPMTTMSGAASPAIRPSARSGSVGAAASLDTSTAAPDPVAAPDTGADEVAPLTAATEAPSAGAEMPAPCPAGLIPERVVGDLAVSEAALARFLESVKQLDGQTGTSLVWLVPLSILSVAGVLAGGTWVRRRRPSADLALGGAETLMPFNFRTPPNTFPPA